MNTKLCLVLILLCFSSNQPFCSEARFSSIGGFGKAFKGLERAVDGISFFCDVFEYINEKYNCSSVSRAVYRLSDTEDTMPDISIGTYVFNFSVGGGSSPQTAPLILDTTLDYTFVLCQCGESCSTDDLPVYDPSKSDTSSNYTCTDPDCPSLGDYVSCSDGNCIYNYAVPMYVNSTGSLVTDTFSIGTSSYSNTVFGCGNSNTGNFGSSIGILGLGYGGLSITSQIGFSNFSYCLGSNGNAVLLFNTGAQLESSTYFLQKFLVPNLFYLNFTGVSVGGKYVDIPSNAYLPLPDGSGGMFLDTTTTVTYLEESAYYAMKEEFVSQMSSYSVFNNSSEYNLDLCFAISPGEQLTIPQLTLHFDGGADMNPQNYSYFSTNSDETVGCLLILPIQGVSVLGTYMQWDMQTIYDVTNGMFYFGSADCSSII